MADTEATCKICREKIVETGGRWVTARFKNASWALGRYYCGLKFRPEQEHKPK